MVQPADDHLNVSLEEMSNFLAMPPMGTKPPSAAASTNSNLNDMVVTDDDVIIPGTTGSDPTGDTMQINQKIGSFFNQKDFPTDPALAADAMQTQYTTKFRGEEVAQFSEMADKLAFKHLRQMKLISGKNSIPTGLSPDQVDRLRGTYLQALTVLYAPPSEDQMVLINQRAITNVSDVLIPGLEAKLREAQNEGLDETQLAQDLSLAKQLAARSGEPRIQEFFRAGVAQGHKSRVSRNTGMDDITAQATQNFGNFQSDPNYVRRSGFVNKLTEMFARNVNYRDSNTGKDQFDGERLFSFAYEGALTQTRLGMIGALEQEDSLSLASIATRLNPSLAAELGQQAVSVSVANETREANLPEAVLQDQLKMSEFIEGVIDASEPFVEQAMTQKAMDPLVRLQSNLSIDPPEGFLDFTEQVGDMMAEGFKKAIPVTDQIASVVGTMAMGTGQKADFFKTSLREIPDGPAVKPWPINNVGDSIYTFAVGESISKAEQRTDEIISAGEDRPGVRMGLKLIASANPELTPQGPGAALAASDLERAEKRALLPKEPGLKGIITELLFDGVLEDTMIPILDLGFQPTTQQAAWAENKGQAINDLLDKSVAGKVTEDDVARAIRNVDGIMDLEGATKVLWTTALATWRDTIAMVASEPHMALAAEVAGGAAATPILKAGTKLLTPIQKALKFDKASRIITRALVEDPQALANARDYMGKLIPEAGDQFANTLDSVVDAIDSTMMANRAHLRAIGDLGMNGAKDLDSGIALRNGRTTAARRSIAVMREVLDGNLDDFMEGIGIQKIAQEWANRPNLAETLFFKVRDRLGWDTPDKIVNMSSVSREPLFNRILRDPETALHDLPINAEILMFDDNLVSTMSKTLGGEQKLLQAKAQQEAVTFMMEYSNDLMLYRAATGESRAGLKSFANFKRERTASRRADRIQELMSEGATQKAAEARVKAFDRALVEIEDQADVLLNAPPGKRGNLPESAMFNNVSGQDLVAHLVSEDSTYGFYHRTRKAFETEEVFWARTNAMARDNDPDFRARVINEYFAEKEISEGGHIKIDDLDDSVVSPQRAEVLRRERDLAQNYDSKLEAAQERVAKSPGNEIFEEQLEILETNKVKLDEMYDGFTKQALIESDQRDLGDLANALNRGDTMSRRAQGIEIDISSNPVTLAQGLEFSENMASPGQKDINRISRETAMTVTMARQAHQERMNNLIEVYRDLPAKDKALFDEVIDRIQEFDVLPDMAALKKHFPDLEHIDKVSDRATTVWDDTAASWADFADDAKIMGHLTDAQFEDMSAWRSRRLFVFEDVKAVKIPGGADPKRGTGIPGINLGRLVGRKMINDWSVLTYPQRGGRPIQRTFKTEAAMKRYVKNTHNTSVSAKTLGEKGEGFGTRVIDGSGGSKVAVLSPLKDTVGAEDMVAGFEGMMLNAREIIDDTMRAGLLSQFDRRGMVIEADDFQRILLDPDLQKELGFEFTGKGTAKGIDSTFTAMPLPDDPKLGSLAGKHVRKSLFKSIQDIDDGFNARVGLANTMEDTLGNVSEFMDSWYSRGAIGTMLGTVGKVNKFMKQAIVNTQLLLRVGSFVRDFAFDFLVTAQVAAPGMGLDPRGWKRMGQAARAVRGVRSSELKLFGSGKKGQKLISDLDPIERELFEMGIVDETLVGRNERGINDIRAIYGEKGGIMDGWKEAKNKGPRMTKVLDRLDRARGLINNPKLTPDEKVVIQKQIQGLEQIAGENLNAGDRWWRRGTNLMNMAILNDQGKFGDITRPLRSLRTDMTNISRSSTYLYLRKEKGMSPALARDTVDTFMQNYSNIPRWVRQTSDSIVGNPFLSFYYEAARIMGNTLKKRPYMIAGFIGAGQGMNIANMIASGTNPHQAMSALTSKGDSLWLAGATNQFIPTQTGPVAMTIPGMELFNDWDSAFGMWGPVMQDAEKTGKFGGPMDDLVSFGKAGLAKAVGTAPLLNYGASLVTGTNSTTGKKYRDGAFLGETKKLLSLMVHPMTPVLGTSSERVTRPVKQGVVGISGRHPNVLNAMARELGFNFHQDLSAVLQDMPAGDGINNIASKVAKGTALLASFGDGVSAPEVLIGEKKGFNQADKLQALVMMSRWMDDDPNMDIVGAENQALSMMRAGFKYIELGKASGNADTEARGRGLLAQAERDYVDTNTMSVNDDQFGRLKGSDKEKVDKMLTAAHNIHAGSGIMKNWGTTRRTAVTAGILLSPEITDKKMRESLFREWIATERSFRSPRNSDDVRGAQQMLQNAIDIYGAPTDPDVQVRIRQMQGMMESWGVMAEFTEKLNRMKDTNYKRMLEARK